MTQHLVDFDLDSVEVELGAPLPDRVLAGNPTFRSWNIEECDDGRLFSGVWESTPGKWRTTYEEWEYCHILSGHCVLTDEAGNARAYKAGDSFIIQPGFKGTWEILETTRKQYVIRVF